MKPIRIGTRRSELALAQATMLAESLKLTAEVPYELVPIASYADTRPEVPLSQLGREGAFVKELQRALAEGLVDVAVHSLKDLPLKEPEGLTVAAICLRESPTDVLVSRYSLGGIGDLPTGAKVGTGSPRRQAQLRHLRPDLQFAPIRGNVPTRILRLQGAGIDAVVVASAALSRLRMAVDNALELSIDQMLPAPGQGALAAEVRIGDARTFSIISAIDDPTTRQCTEIERAFLRAIGGGCHSSAAAYCRPGPGGLYLLDAGLEVQGQFRRIHFSFEGTRAQSIAEEAARALLDAQSGY